ncbi:phosphoserine phosphatase SerB [Psittacicella gerlachiana]|uniref:Phosphoserine phosphatase n=1 Tax=Psittacicella gerlachiana TaxID=2028574 RepID=A0A3A1YMV7_9GAMM|nr:phosphoserine phosphatase SerB [Psittacicella gerlachiana]RIY38891.1 phosphoserine phosphatase SerB [Psittacicella gerlachiana]
MVKLATFASAQRTIMRQTAAALAAYPANNLTTQTYQALLSGDSQALAQALASLPATKTEKEFEELKEHEKEVALRIEKQKDILRNPEITLIAAVFIDLPVAKLLMNLPDYNASIHVVKIYHDTIVVVMSTDKYSAFRDFLWELGADSVELSLVPLLSAGGALVSDMDSTMVTCECIDQIASLCGIEEQVASITEAAMQGKLDFTQSLRERVALLKGVKVEEFTKIIENLPITLGADTLLALLNEREWHSALVSGGFIPFATAVAQALGFKEFFANTLGQDHDALNGVVLNGEVLGEIVDANFKEKVVQNYQEQGLTTIALGDGANDLKMLQASDFAVAYHAKPVVNEHADFCIKHNDLRALLCVLEIRAWLEN